MAEEKIETREMTWRRLFPWTELFRGFQVALDLNKLLLAAAGILVMSFGWWLLATIFSSGSEPRWPGNWEAETDNNPALAWSNFQKQRDRWNVLHEATGYGSGKNVWTLDHLADSKAEYDLLNSELSPPDRVATPSERMAYAEKLERLVQEKKLPEFTEARAEVFRKYLGTPKRGGTLATLPWFEDRGSNPYLLVTGQSGVSWEPGHFWEWFAGQQAPVIFEPLVKLFRPIVYFFSPRASGFTLRTYFFLATLWMLVTWSVFGGAITRIAVVQVARGDKIGMTEALRYTFKRLVSYITAPLFPLSFVAVLVVLMCLFGVVHMVPLLGDIVSGLFWPVMIAFGLAMAVALVGFVGWPLMSATISAQGTDSWEAVSRSYSYVYQKPWQYIWYGLVAVAYGAVLVFFVGFLGSFAVYLSKWGVAQTPFVETANRDPAFLFAYAPTSFGWRTLLLEGVKVDGKNLVENGQIDPAVWTSYVSGGDSRDVLSWRNQIGAVLVAAWLYLLFLLILGFGYSYFWSASTIIYLLLRKQVDAEEMDEVHLEEEDESFSGAPALAPAPVSTSPSRGGTPLTMVEPPQFRPAPPAAPSQADTAPVPATPATSGDGNPPPGSN